MVQIIDNRPPVQPRRIDYDRMRREWPKQKAALTRALKSGSAEKVANVCIAAVKVWDEVGAWPDAWSLFSRALNDVLPWNVWVDFDDVVYGRVTIKDTEDED